MKTFFVVVLLGQTVITILGPLAFTAIFHVSVFDSINHFLYLTIFFPVVDFKILVFLSISNLFM